MFVTLKIFAECKKFRCTISILLPIATEICKLLKKIDQFFYRLLPKLHSVCFSCLCMSYKNYSILEVFGIWADLAIQISFGSEFCWN